MLDLERNTNHRARCSAFTLVELLVAISILTILAGLVLGMAAGAATTGRVSRTKIMVSRIHTLVTQHYDTYRTRRVEVNDAVRQQINSRYTSGGDRGKALAEARLYAMRELMIMEMPDRWSDVMLAPIDGTPSAVRPRLPLYLKTSSGSTHGGPTPLIEAYRRQYYRIASRPGVTAEQIVDNQGAECLYMMVMFATADGEARGLFSEYQIGDVDGDGAPEFIDGWGRPVSYLRWAPGYPSPLGPSINAATTDTELRQLAAADHDPFDLFRSDVRAFRMVPLVYSGGVDKEYGINNVKSAVRWRTAASVQLQTPNQAEPYYMAPASRVSIHTALIDENSQPTLLGSFPGGDSTAATDNITNHLIAAE
jgi:prepilin-type N-terminal cleavage/methylation domain-containing protein